jgi:hypothetical protein
MQAIARTVRTALFVPASRPERIPKALASGADTVIVDLEDAVEHLAKDNAREALCDFLGTHPEVRLWVRINDASTPWHDDDLKACHNHPGVAAIVLPKTETQAHVRHAAQTGIDIVPILETADGVLNAAEIAATPGVQRLAFGSLDYGLDLGLTTDSDGAGVVLDHARVQVLLRSRAAGLAPAHDGVFPACKIPPACGRPPAAPATWALAACCASIPPRWASSTAPSRRRRPISNGRAAWSPCIATAAPARSCLKAKWSTRPSSRAPASYCSAPASRPERSGWRAGHWRQVPDSRRVSGTVWVRYSRRFTVSDTLYLERGSD